MKHNFGYFFREGARNMLSHGFMSFAAVTSTVACLLIMGTFSLIAYNAAMNLETLQKENAVVGFVDEDLSMAQAQALEAKGVRIDHVVSIEVDDHDIANRMGGRRVCSKCGASYHVVAKPPKQEGVCDSCGGELIIRKDDAPETVLKRLAVYHASTEVLKDYYAKLGRLHTVNGNQSIEGANEEILKTIGAKA